MAFDYDGASDGVFKHIGKCVKHYNLQGTDATNLDADVQEILDVFAAGDRDLLVEGLAQDGESWKADYVGRRAALVAYAIARLQQRESVLEEIGAISSDLTEVLPKLIRQMTADSETIDRSTVTLGIPAAKATNTGTGTILVTTLLDGISSPGAGPAGPYPAIAEYRGVNTELAVTSETMRLICSADSAVDGLTEGSEVFTWSGGPQHTLHGVESSEGSGLIGSIRPTAAAALLSNLDFETKSATNTPASWTIDLGTAGTHVFVTTTSGQYFHGSSGLKLTGTGALASHKLSQTFTGIGSSIKGNKLYVLTARVKASSVPSAGDLTIQLEGTGYTADAGTVEVQTVQISGTPTGGTYTLSWRGQTTAAIAYDATSATVQAALRLLTGLESVVVSTSAGAPPDVTHQITFYGVPDNTDQLTSASSLTGGTPAIAHATTTPGVRAERIYLPAASLPTTWGLRYCFILLPETLPSDLELVVKVTNTLENAKSIYVDDITFDEVQYGGGVGVVLVRGDTQFARGDEFTFTVANDEAGTFQQFFRRAFGVQLPSSGSPSIADSLAT